jgi:hypothetical protein
MLSPSCLPAGVATSLRNAAHPKTHPQFSFKGFYIFPECNREQSQRLDESKDGANSGRLETELDALKSNKGLPQKVTQDII